MRTCGVFFLGVMMLITACAHQSKTSSESEGEESGTCRQFRSWDHSFSRSDFAPISVSELKSYEHAGLFYLDAHVARTPPDCGPCPEGANCGACPTATWVEELTSKDQLTFEYPFVEEGKTYRFYLEVNRTTFMVICAELQ